MRVVELLWRLMAACLDDWSAVPFKNDFVKKAVMLEQAKLEATKLGVPVELVTGTRQGESDAPDPLAAMTKQALSRAESVEAKRESDATPTQQRVETLDEEFDGDDGQQDATGGGSSAKKDGGCVAM